MNYIEVSWISVDFSRRIKFDRLYIRLDRIKGKFWRIKLYLNVVLD